MKKIGHRGSMLQKDYLPFVFYFSIRLLFGLPAPVMAHQNIMCGVTQPMERKTQQSPNTELQELFFGQ